MDNEMVLDNEELYSFETLEDYGVDALGAAGTSCTNNCSHVVEQSPEG